MNAQAILKFWFEELTPKQWWVKDPVLDRQIADRFGEIHLAASRCELFSWREDAAGKLAEIIVLDQFSRNIHRDTALAFATDPIALTLAQEAVRLGVDKDLDPAGHSFICLICIANRSLSTKRR